MNIVENYALSSGQKISPFEIEYTFFPLSTNKYITFQPFSKDSKNYDLYSDVLLELLPILGQNGITVVQIGGKDEPGFPGCYFTQGQTTLNQVNYIIKNSLLHFGSDSFGAHLAGINNLPSVTLYSNNYIDCVKPYFGDKKNQIFLKAETENKPSFSFSEFPKSINKIKSEDIVYNVLKLLNIEYTPRFKTLTFNHSYLSKMVESIPNQVVNPHEFNAEVMIYRMDHLFDLNYLEAQLSHFPTVIVTKNKISLDLLKKYRANVRQVIYIVDRFSSNDFCEELLNNGFSFNLCSYEVDNNQINKIKESFYNYGIIQKKGYLNDEFKKIVIQKMIDKGVGFSSLKIKSNKTLLSNGQRYAGYYFWINNIPMKDHYEDIYDDFFFWQESEHFKFLIDTKNIDIKN